MIARCSPGLLVHCAAWKVCLKVRGRRVAPRCLRTRASITGGQGKTRTVASFLTRKRASAHRPDRRETTGCVGNDAENGMPMELISHGQAARHARWCFGTEVSARRIGEGFEEFDEFQHFGFGQLQLLE